MKVVLDAGHSKETMGKRSFDNTFFEYAFNRQVTAQISAHLKRHGVEVVLTAPTEAEVALAERCAIANSVQADCFVSIHANAFGTDWNEANGWEIYALSVGGQGEKLAKAIEASSIPYVGIKNRGVKVSDFYVLKHTDMPAVLIEHGFYTNKAELALLKSADFQAKCAIADSKGILSFLGLPWIDGTRTLADDVAPWAKEAQKWVMAQGISDGLRAKEAVTREELWVMLMAMKN